MERARVSRKGKNYGGEKVARQVGSLYIFRLASALTSPAKDCKHNQEHDADEDDYDSDLERRDDECDERNQLSEERDDQK